MAREAMQGDRLQTVAGRFARLLENDSDQAAEALWLGGLARLKLAAETAESGLTGRFRSHPPGELRRLRRDVARAMAMLRMAADLQQLELDHERELMADLVELTRAASARARRDQTAEATRVRQLRRRCRAEGREPTREELYPWLAADGDRTT